MYWSRVWYTSSSDGATEITCSGDQHRAVRFHVAVATATALLVLTLGLVLPGPSSRF
jgi:hypothetical protein